MLLMLLTAFICINICNVVKQLQFITPNNLQPWRDYGTSLQRKTPRDKQCMLVVCSHFVFLSSFCFSLKSFCVTFFVVVLYLTDLHHFPSLFVFCCFLWLFCISLQQTHLYHFCDVIIIILDFGYCSVVMWCISHVFPGFYCCITVN